MASGNHCCSFFLILSCPQLWVAPHDNPLCCLLLHSRLGPLTQSPLMSNWNSHTFSCFKQSKKQIFKAIWSLPIYILHKTSPIICKPQVSQILGYIKDPRLLLHFGTVWPGGSPPSCSVSLPKHKHFLSHFPFFPANILVLFPIWGLAPMPLSLEGLLRGGSSPLRQPWPCAAQTKLVTASHGPVSSSITTPAVPELTTNPYKRETGGAELVVGDITMEASRWCDARKGSWSQECRQPPETERGKEMDSCLKPPEGMSPSNNLSLDFSPPEG